MAPARACRFLATPTGCRFGTRCKFSHAVDPSVTFEGTQPHDIVIGDPRHKQDSLMMIELRNWRAKIPKHSGQIRPWKLVNFFLEALELVRSDVETMQEIVIHLAKDDGLVTIKYFLEKSQKPDDIDLKSYLRDDILPFFDIMCYSGVQRSTLLENHVATIYNGIHGPQGTRAASLFDLLTSVLLSSDTKDWIELEQLNHILIVFSCTTEINGAAFINERMKVIADLLVIKAVDACVGIDTSINLSICKSVKRIRRYFETESHDVSRTQEKKHIQGRAQFTHSQLSAGGRHDNDYNDINKISIMPTFDEIQSIHQEYLPGMNEYESSTSPFEFLIDRHFRFLREDTVGQLRDAVRASMQADVITLKSNDSSIMRTHTYKFLEIKSIKFSSKSGFQILVEFEQPSALQGHNTAWRKQWWERSRRLQPDALVCIVNRKDLLVYCVVTAQGTTAQQQVHKLRQSDEDDDGLSSTPSKTENIFDDAEHAIVTLKTIDGGLKDLLLLQRQMDACFPGTLELVEFPGVLLPSFQPTLLALQGMQKSQDMPFMDLLTSHTTLDAAMSSKPAYANSPDFCFDLKDVTIDKESFKFSPHEDLDLGRFLQKTTLDSGQAEALLHCLRTSFALIQGPPGTGKSYTGVAIIKVLLAVQKRASLGPILCVCYTNHALDQLLEHLWASDVKQIVRIGSRSKSEILADINLRKVSQSMVLTKAEKQKRWELWKALSVDEKSIAPLLEQLEHINNVSTISEYLSKRNPSHHRQLFEKDVDEEGFQKVQKKQKNPILSWLSDPYFGTEGPTRSTEQLQYVSLFEMTCTERAALHNDWLDDIRQLLLDKLQQEAEDFFDHDKQHKNIRTDLDLRCLNKAHVVGVTTTGMARNLALLRRLDAKVLICEEAGEVLEAHILTALLPSLEHVILIGDHKQLRPQVQNYELSRESSQGRKYSLDMSLFERLVTGSTGASSGLPHRVLEIQRRMHPFIADLVRQTVYPKLQDAANVRTYPEVAGIQKRLFWLDHKHYEDRITTDSVTTSRSNSYEVAMTTSLVSHLVRQGRYQAHDIAVLTPYLAQMFQIKASLSSVMEVALDDRDLADAERQGIDTEETEMRYNAVKKTTLLGALRLATVDNFQGEEAKVVIISLVRSNPQNNCGFLKTSNRINVLLSRAQHGMYIIGNADTASSVSMWRQVQQLLAMNGNIGDKLELACPRHPTTPIFVSEPEHFVVLSPEGGCQLLCDRRLTCGHSCPNKCHSPLLHKVVRCLEPCSRSLPSCDHPCPRPCGDPCVVACEMRMEGQKLKLICDHIIQDPLCWQLQQSQDIACEILIEKYVEGCEHIVSVACSILTTNENFCCPAHCGNALPCGHSCKQKCGLCRPRHAPEGFEPNHPSCTQICGRSYNTCNHSCQKRCHVGQSCPPCLAACNVACVHSKCDKKCHEPCAPCAQETCSSVCPHSKCSMPCAAPCDWLPCDKRCPKVLACGHQCPSLCGEICPAVAYCQICAHDTTKAQVADYVMMEAYSEIDLDQDPCIFPLCGHIVTTSSLDGLLSLNDFYILNDDGHPTATKGLIWNLNARIPGCPQCRGNIRNINRYGRIVRQALLADSTKKFINHSNSEFIPLTQAVLEEQESLTGTRTQAAQNFVKQGLVPVRLQGSREVQIRNIRDSGISSRYKRLISVYNMIRRYSVRVQRAEQPFQRVWDSAQHVRRMNKVNLAGFELDTSALQTRQSLLARSLSIKTHLILLCDFLSVVSTETKTSDVDLQTNRMSSMELAEEAKDTSQPSIELEAYLYYAQYCAIENNFLNLRLEQQITSNISEAARASLRVKIEDLKTEGCLAVKSAKSIQSAAAGSTRHLIETIEEVEKMVKTSSIYDVVRPQEWKAVMEAMRADLGGTRGHWYYCQNGHVFTIGECGGAMRVANCPQCGVLIGGTNHQTVEGVTHADDLVRQVENMQM